MWLPDIPNHPAIANALRTGYPHPPDPPGTHECWVCGAPSQCWRADGGYWCYDCARKEFDELSDEDAVELLGFEVLGDE